MSWIAVAIVGGSLISGALGSHAATSAADTQAGAARDATDAQLRMFNQTRDDQAPWRTAGGSSLAEIMKGFGDDGYFNHKFGPEDLKAGLAPNYDFMLKQGQDAVTNQSNAMGGLGGNSLKAINDYTQNYAQNAYQQAYNNYTQNQTNIYNRLASIAGLGQTAGSNATTGSSTVGGNIANTITGAGNASAAGQVGAANAWSGAINNGISLYGLSRGWYGGNASANAGGPT